MPCPPAASMENCDPKCRCNSGPCAGTAFSCGNPCPAGVAFNPQTCECDPPPCYKYPGNYRVDFDFTIDYTARKSCTRNNVCSINCETNPRVSCGVETTSGSFDYSGGCLVPTYLNEAFDICGEPILSPTLVFYSCDEPVADPTAPGAPCIFEYARSRPGCDGGATSASLSFNVVDLNA